jgi:hypothetical protein
MIKKYIRLGVVRSIDYFSFSISMDYIYYIDITIVLFKRGISICLIKRKKS